MELALIAFAMAIASIAISIHEYFYLRKLLHVIEKRGEPLANDQCVPEVEE